MSDTAQRLRLLKWLIVPTMLLVAAASWFFLDPGFRSQKPSTGVATVIPNDEFDRRVREYILNNPEIVIEAVQRFEQRQRARQENEANAVISSRANEILRDKDSPVGGNPDGDVTLVEFFDYNCPYCRRVTPIMEHAEKADPKLRVVYKELPILGAGSVYSAKAALAAHKQGKYLAFHKELMLGQGVADESRVLEIAAKIGLDVERMKSDMDDPAIATAIENNLALAQALRINGTPGFVIGDKIIRGAIDLKAMQALIRETREKL